MKKSIIFLVLLVAISLLAVFMPAVPGQIVTEGIDSGDVAWMLAATALVLLMTPGLAYFYGGMIDTKNIISTMLQSFIAMGVISVLWIVVGFSLAFGEDIGGVIGNPAILLHVSKCAGWKTLVISTNDSFSVVCILSIKVCHHHTGFDHRNIC